MTNDSAEQKKKCCLPALILCLVHHWTLGDNPKKDLEELQIKEIEVIATLLDLANRRLVKPYIERNGEKYFICQILTQPQKFREAVILTKQGQELCRCYHLETMKSMWLKILKGVV